MAIVAIAAAIAPTADAGHGKHRSDLVVSKGSVSAAAGQLTGSFDVRNKGAAKAKKTSAALIVQAPGDDRTAGSFRVKSLKSSASRTIQVDAPVPSGLPDGSLPIAVCLDPKDKVREKSEGNNCKNVGTIDVSSGPTGPGNPASSVPTDPIPFSPDDPLEISNANADYWVNVPSSYDASHQTPTILFVWLHGCGGSSAGDIYTVSPEDRDWISIAPGGRETGDACWFPNVDQPKVFAAIADVKTHFNINPRSVILGGYSSGGDLAYRTAFYNSDKFAGLLAENTAPFKDTGSTQQQSLAAATTKFHVVHLAHTEDEAYDIDQVRNEFNAVKNAGFPATLIERPGTHSDGNTDSDLINFLLPHIDDGWLSP